MKVDYDKYSEKYFFTTERHGTVAAMDLESLESFTEMLKQICNDEYSRVLQFDLEGDGKASECEGGSCVI